MSDFGKDINVPSNDCISRQAAIEIASGYCHPANIAKELAALPSVHPKFPENWWKTDHGYMWLCPHCGLPVHSDFGECLRCGIKRPSAQHNTDYSDGYADGYKQGIKDAQPEERTEERTETHACDCISRQAAIQVLDNAAEHWNIAEPYHEGIRAGYRNSARLLLSLPSEQPIECRKQGEWDMFELITSAWYGKQYYFKEENGMAYSRKSHKTMTVHDAILEFIREIGDDGSN